MYIAPNSKIRILKNCPCDPDYTNTVYFESVANQTSYFMGLTKHKLSGQYYQRANRNYCRVQLRTENLYDCNYLMFQNTSFGNKWFYAFITDITYINNEVSEIEYTLDDIQTWLFDWTFNACFVERMHSATDEIGDNIVPEPVDIGEYVYNGTHEPANSKISELVIPVVVIGVCDVDNDNMLVADGKIYDNTYSALKLYAYSYTRVGKINTLINEYKNAPDAVVTIYTAPRCFFNENDIDSDAPVSGISATPIFGLEIDPLTSISTIDGHIVRNKKLFTYPYNFVNVNNGCGQSLALRYEFFDDITPRVNIEGCITQPVQAILHPTNYKRSVKPSGTFYHNYMDESLTLGNYPLCSWNVDSWKAWVAQNAIPIGIGVGADLVRTVINPHAGMSLVNDVASVVSEGYSASIKADVAKGNLSSGNVNFARSNQTFFHGRMSVNRQSAQIIDSFFDRFGYAQKRIMYPNMCIRKNWTYIKTLGCTIHGSIPADAERNITKIFDNGVTFWVRGDAVGNYTLDNTIDT